MIKKKQAKDLVEEIELGGEAELQDKVISIDRISRTVKGGRRIRFRALIALGDRQGSIGVGNAKANDVQTAIAKAKAKAKKSMIKISIKTGTIPYEVSQTFSGSTVLLKPAREGHSIIAGGAVRTVVELSGIKNIVSKAMGSTNAVNCATATVLALKNFQDRPTRSKR